MDIDELINLQWDLERNDHDAPSKNIAPSSTFRTPIRHSLSEEGSQYAGYSQDVKRPLSEKDCNVNSQEVLNDGMSDPHLRKCHMSCCIQTHSSSSTWRACSCRGETSARSSISHKSRRR